ncbi:unnamed protein product [Rotaria sp. Silwood1]|nr:unnamed protein product [Rotaria sp. Silwood1]
MSSIRYVHYSNQIKRGPDGSLQVVDNSGNRYFISRRFGWSKHNCSCRGRKTGLVLYPYDTKYKNVVLLVCENCYGYQPNNGTQHEQLLNWYNRLYCGSKTFRFVSGFYMKEDGSLGFNSASQNANGIYSNGSREMSPIEQDAVRKVVNGKLDDYTV